MPSNFPTYSIRAHQSKCFTTFPAESNATGKVFPSQYLTLQRIKCLHSTQAKLSYSNFPAESNGTQAHRQSFPITTSQQIPFCSILPAEYQIAFQHRSLGSAKLRQLSCSMLFCDVLRIHISVFYVCLGLPPTSTLHIVARRG